MTAANVWPCAGWTFGSPCSEQPEPGRAGVVICDRHEVETRAQKCGIAPRQWLMNVGMEHRILELFPEPAE
jgi:hypothetical protein